MTSPPPKADPAVRDRSSGRHAYVRSLADLQQRAHRNAFTTHQVAVAAGDTPSIVRSEDDRCRHALAIALHQHRLDWLVANGLLQSRRHFPRVAVRIPRELGQEQSEARLKQLEASCAITLYSLTAAGLQMASCGGM